MNGEHEARRKHRDHVLAVELLLLLLVEIAGAWWLMTHDALFTPARNLLVAFVMFGFVPYLAYVALDKSCE